MAEWQTRYLEGVVSLWAFGFKSRCEHHGLVSQRQRNTAQNRNSVGSTPTEVTIWEAA